MVGTVKQLLLSEGVGSCATKSRWKWKHQNTISETVKTFMQILVNEMNSLDPLLELEMHFHGSSKEGTKVGLLDEFDCRLHLTGLEKDDFVLVEEELKHNIILKINKDNEIAVQRWGTFCDNNRYLVPNRLFRHIYKTMCKALVQTKKGKCMKKIKLYLKDVNNEQVHFEWVCSPDQGMPLKIDVVFVVTVTGWWPQKGIKDSKLLPKDAFHKTNVLLRTNGWRPSSALQELMVMSNIQPIPKYAYIMCKIINNLVVYSKADSRNKVKTYHLKNALWILYEAVQVDPMNSPLSMGPKMLHLWELNDSHMEQIWQWTLAICKHGLSHLIAGKTFYFELSQSSLHQEQLQLYTKMMYFLITQRNMNNLDFSMLDMPHLYLQGQNTDKYIVNIDNDAKQCPNCLTHALDREDNLLNYRTCHECQTVFCWLCLRRVSFFHFFTLSGCTISGKKKWSGTNLIVFRILSLLLVVLLAPLVIACGTMVIIIVIVIGLPKLLTSTGTQVFSGSEDLSSVAILHVVKLGYNLCANLKIQSYLITVLSAFIASFVLAAIVLHIAIPTMVIVFYIVILLPLINFVFGQQKVKDKKTMKSKKKMKKMKKCPACFLPNERHYYNHVTCEDCNADYCWLCGNQVYFLHFLWPSGCTYAGDQIWSYRCMWICWLLLMLTSPFSVVSMAVLCTAVTIIGFPMYMTHLHANKFADTSLVSTGILALLVSPILALVITGTVVICLVICIVIVYPLIILHKSFTAYNVLDKHPQCGPSDPPIEDSKNKKACSTCNTINVKNTLNYITCFQCHHTFCWLCTKHDVGYTHFLPYQTGCPIWGKMKWSYQTKLVCMLSIVCATPSLLTGVVCACISFLICTLLKL